MTPSFCNNRAFCGRFVLWIESGFGQKWHHSINMALCATVRGDESVYPMDPIFAIRWSVSSLSHTTPTATSPIVEVGPRIRIWKRPDQSGFQSGDANKSPHTPRSAWSLFRHRTGRPQLTHKAPCYTLIGCLATDVAS